ncbi:hypothetical protein D3C75_1009960 [compost metagenome]
MRPFRDTRPLPQAMYNPEPALYLWERPCVAMGCNAAPGAQVWISTLASPKEMITMRAPT